MKKSRAKKIIRIAALCLAGIVLVSVIAAGVILSGRIASMMSIKHVADDLYTTCGLVPKIYSLVEDAPHVTLCISLHAPNNEIRDRLMPVNKSWRMEELIPAAKHYADVTGRRVIFEYALVDGVNSSEECAAELASRLRGINCHVNLIPLNSVKERDLNGVTRAYAHTFAGWLEKRHISATVRRELGTDIDGACGQLRNKHAENGGENETD